MYSKFVAGSIITATFLFAGAYAADQPLPGEKTDSGLGALPPYSEWRNHPELAHMASPEMGPAVMVVARKIK